MPRNRRFDLIVFDWDGTLFDSTRLIARSIQAACGDVGTPVPSDKDASYVIGLGLAEALMHAAPTLPRERYPELAARYRHHYRASQHDIVLFEGTLEMLRDLKARNHRAGGRDRQDPARPRRIARSLVDERSLRRHPHRRRDARQARSADAHRADASSAPGPSHRVGRRHHARPPARGERRMRERRRQLRRASSPRPSACMRPCMSRTAPPIWQAGWPSMADLGPRPAASSAADAALLPQRLCAGRGAGREGTGGCLRRGSLPRAGACLRDTLRRPCRRLPEPLRPRAHRARLAARRVPRRRRRFIVCAIHGATYAPQSGHCVGGPCGSGRLVRIATVERDGAVWWQPTRDTRAPPDGPLPPV